MAEGELGTIFERDWLKGWSSAQFITENFASM